MGLSIFCHLHLDPSGCTNHRRSFWSKIQHVGSNVLLDSRHSRPVLCQKLVDAVDSKTSRWVCRWTHGYIMHDLHVRDLSPAVSRLASWQLFACFSFGQLFLALGIKILQETSPLKFRNIFYSEFVFCGLWLIPMLWIPESPCMDSDSLFLMGLIATNVI